MPRGFNRESRVSQAIAAAAEAATVEEMGREVLPALGNLFQTSKLLFYRSEPSRPFVAIAGDTTCLPEYTASFAGQDPLQHYMQVENPDFFSGTRCRAWRELRAMPGLTEFYARWDLTWLLHLRLSATGHMEPGFAGITLSRSAKQRDFDSADLKTAAAILPSLAAAMRRIGRLQERGSSDGIASAILERACGTAVVALSLQGKLLWVSQRAERLLDSILERGGLPSALAELAFRFAKLLRRPGAESGRIPPFYFAWTDHSGRRHEIEAYLARTQTGEAFVALDFGGEMPPGVAEIAERCGLTRTETEILLDLARGRADAEIATGRFVSIPTVRTHVTRILQKCGVRSRLQAVALALGTAARSHLTGLMMLLGGLIPVSFA